YRRGRRNHRLERNREAAPAPHHALAAVEWRFPVEPLGDAVEHLLDGGVFQDGAGRLWAAVAQQVLLAELERIALERARDHVGMALVSPHSLRNAEAAQRASRRQICIERVGI